MINYDLEANRLKRISLIIEDINHKSNWCPVKEALPPGFESHFTEMLEYSGSSGSFSRFTDFFQESVQYLVWIPQPLKKYIRQGDVFLMTLGLTKNSWKILYSSTSYEQIEMEWDEGE